MLTDNSLLRKRFLRLLPKFSGLVASFRRQGNKNFVKISKGSILGVVFVFCTGQLVSYKIVQCMIFHKFPSGVEVLPITYETNLIHRGKYFTRNDSDMLSKKMSVPKQLFFFCIFP